MGEPEEVERIVVVAGWTSALDAVGRLCSTLGLACSRLDGSTPPDARAATVAAFNAGARRPHCACARILKYYLGNAESGSWR